MPTRLPTEAEGCQDTGGGLPIGNGKDAYRDTDGDAYKKGEGCGAL